MFPCDNGDGRAGLAAGATLGGVLEAEVVEGLDAFDGREEAEEEAEGFLL